MNIVFPLQGVRRSADYQSQAPYSCLDALNARSKDVFKLRDRGGRRPGTHKYHSFAVADSEPVDPCNMLASVFVEDADYKGYYADTFEGQTLDTGWQTPHADWLPGGAAALPSLVTHPWGQAIASIFGSGATKRGMYRDLPRFDPNGPHLLEAYLMPYNKQWWGKHTLFTDMDSTETNAEVNSFEVEFAITGTNGAWTCTVNTWLLGSIDETNNSSGTDGFVEPGWLQVWISGTTVAVFWRGAEIFRNVYGSPPSVLTSRCAVELEATVSGGRVMMDEVRSQHNGIRESTRNFVVSAHGGKLYRETFMGLLQKYNSNVSADPELADDELLSAVDRGQRLFIADHQRSTRVAGTMRIDFSSPGVAYVTVPTGGEATWPAYGNDYAALETWAAVIKTGAAAGTYRVVGLAGANTQLQIAYDSVASPSFAGYDATAEVCRAPKDYRPRSKNQAGDELFSWLAVAGKGQIPCNCPIVVRVGERIFLMGDPPHVWYATREGDPYDMDVSRQDAQAARFGPSSPTGMPHFPIVAGISHTDDYLIMAGVDQMSRLRGNPAYDATADVISTNLGVVDRYAWCIDPQGQIIFMSRQGLGGLAAGGSSYPALLSQGVVPDELLNIDNISTRVLMAYNHRFGGVDIWLSPQDTTSKPRRSWFFDLARGEYWPVDVPIGQYPTAILNHTSAQQGEMSDVITGCRDGYTRRYHRRCSYDDGTAIVSNVKIGPLHLGGNGREGITNTLRGTLAADSGSITWSLATAQTFEGVETATARESGTWRTGFSHEHYPRLRGIAALLTLTGAENYPWATEFGLDGCALEFEDGGPRLTG